MWVFILILVIILASAGFSWLHDKLTWNNGVCKKTGKKWIWYGTHGSNGDRVYRTDDAKDWCTISWKVDGDYKA